MSYSNLLRARTQSALNRTHAAIRDIAQRAVVGCALIASIAGAVGPLTPAQAQTAVKRDTCDAIDRDLLNAPSIFRYGLSRDELKVQFFGEQSNPDDGSYNDDGYRPIRITGYKDDGEVRFATKWVRAAGPAWESSTNMTGDAFDARYNQLKDTHRVVDISAYNTPDGPRYAVIWEENSEGIQWAVKRRTPQASMNALKAGMKANGLAPTRVEGYTLDGDIHFASVWTEVGRGCRWDLQFNLIGGDYQVLADANYEDTRLIHVDSYHDGSIARYAGIWWDQSGPTLAASHGGHWYTFQRLLNNRSCEGYALDNFYVDEAPSGWNYMGGVWSYRGPPNVSDASSLQTRVNHHVNCADGRAGGRSST